MNKHFWKMMVAFVAIIILGIIGVSLTGRNNNDNATAKVAEPCENGEVC